MRVFEHIKLDALNFDMRSVTKESGRVYETPGGRLYPSVTTVLSSFNKEGLYAWRKRVGEQEANRISRLATSRGTKLHNAVEKYILNELSPLQLKTMMPDTKSMFQKVKSTLDEKLGKIYCIEQALYSDSMGIAGRVDCIAEWDGVLSIVDWKTSTKNKDEKYIQNYFMQCGAYAQMFEELTGTPIEQIVVVIAVEEEDKPQLFPKNKTPYIPMLTEQINNYRNKLV